MCTRGREKRPSKHGDLLEEVIEEVIGEINILNLSQNSRTQKQAAKKHLQEDGRDRNWKYS